MRMTKFFIGVVLFFLDVLIIYSFPYRFVIQRVDDRFFLFGAGGFLLYIVFHSINKPENFYIWNHEFSHLLVSKLFFKNVKGFHITRSKGGRVVLDGTNFIIDLAPYLFYPLIIALLFLAILIKRAGFPAVISFYFVSSGFLLGMMFAFGVESFIKIQEDIKRNGIIFSASIILCMNFLSFPAYLLPGINGKKLFLLDLSLLWWENISTHAVDLLNRVTLLLQFT